MLLLARPSKYGAWWGLYWCAAELWFCNTLGDQRQGTAFESFCCSRWRCARRTPSRLTLVSTHASISMLHGAWACLLFVEWSLVQHL